MKTIINLCLILLLCCSFKSFADEADVQRKSLNQLRADIILTQDALWDLCFYHINELGEYTKSFRKAVCDCVWLPDAMKGFILNAHPDFLNKIDDLPKVIYELKCEEDRIHVNQSGYSSENNNKTLELYDNLLKKQYFSSYNKPKVLVSSSEGKDYEFRREFKLFCKIFNIQPYIIVGTPMHSEKCTGTCEYAYPFHISDNYQEEEYHYGYKPSLFYKIKSIIRGLYTHYLKEHPFEIHQNKKPDGRIVFTFLQNRIPFHTWLTNKVYEIIQNRSKKDNGGKEYLQKDLPIILEKIRLTFDKK